MATILIVSDPAAAIECQTRKGEGPGWSWRQVDGKRCWFKGSRNTNKKLLRWAKPKATALPRPPPATEGRRRAFVPEPTLLVWPHPPPIPAPVTFEERWCAPCIKGVP